MQIVSHTQSNDPYSWTGSIAVNSAYTTKGLTQFTAAGLASLCSDANGYLTAEGIGVFLSASKTGR